ncbi:effector-associated constant component EACC1 [Actinophytocola sediminis]
MVAGTAVIRIAGSDADEELRKLACWLRDEDELRGRIELVAAPVRQGQMGGALETVSVMVTSGSAAVLVRSLFTWLARRREAEKVTLTLNAKTRKLDLTCGSPADVEQVLKSCREFLDDA